MPRAPLTLLIVPPARSKCSIVQLLYADELAVTELFTAVAGRA
jgi:hypothetical protein